MYEKRITANDVLLEDVSQEGYFATVLHAGQPCMVRQLACLLWLAVLSCISLAVAGCNGSSVTGTSAHAGPLAASPSLAVFGSVPVGQSASAIISVTNSGSVAMQITQISVTEQSYSLSGVGNLPVTVGAGSTYQFS